MWKVWFPAATSARRGVGAKGTALAAPLLNRIYKNICLEVIQIGPVLDLTSLVLRLIILLFDATSPVLRLIISLFYAISPVLRLIISLFDATNRVLRLIIPLFDATTPSGFACHPSMGGEFGVIASSQNQMGSFLIKSLAIIIR